MDAISEEMLPLLVGAQVSDTTEAGLCSNAGNKIAKTI